MGAADWRDRRIETTDRVFPDIDDDVPDTNSLEFSCSARQSGCKMLVLLTMEW